MKKTAYFIDRNIKELMRDMLSFIFCIAFPAVMLAVFTLINSYTGGYTPMFEPKALAPSLCCFSYSFVMLFTALLVSKDRSASLLARLYTSPLKTFGFIVGYAVPGIIAALAQTLTVFLCGGIVSLITETEYIGIDGALFCCMALLPHMLFYIALGIIFGSLFSDKAAPGISSVIISAGSMLSGAWMPLETMGEFEKFCRCLPFYPAVITARQAANLSFDDAFLPSFITMSLFALVICVLAVPAFNKARNSM